MITGGTPHDRTRPPGLRGAAAALLFGAVVVCSGYPLDIKLGSLMPAASPWDKSFRKLAADWGAMSGGAVTMTVYSGGVIGDEDGMVRKMRIGQIHAAAMTIKGLNKIVPGMLAVAAPMLYRSDAELDYVIGKLRPTLDAELEAAGYTVILWSRVGWVYFFASRPVLSPEDLRPLRLWLWGGDVEEEQAWKNAGFWPVVRPATEIMVGLQSGAIQALATSPLTAAGYQWFSVIPNMTDLPWAPFLGAVVVKSDTWNRIAPELRTRLLERARQTETELNAAMDGAIAGAIGVMRDYGLEVHRVGDAERAKWQALADYAFGALVGKSFDRETWEAARGFAAEYRRRSGGGQ